MIEVKDDGYGLEAEKIVQIAKAKGLISGDHPFSEKEAFELIFKPGFSTKSKTTDVSGRGIGMDVVKANVEMLGGEVKIESAVGLGTTFRIILPLTMAIIDGLVIQINQERYVFPLIHVHETLKLNDENVKVMTGIGDTLILREESIPLYYLGDLLPLANIVRQKNLVPNIAIVVRSGSHPFAISVDDIIGQYQVVVKQMGQEIRHIKGISGSTILGDGRPALILEPADLIRNTHGLRNLRYAS